MAEEAKKPEAEEEGMAQSTPEESQAPEVAPETPVEGEPKAPETPAAPAVSEAPAPSGKRTAVIVIIVLLLALGAVVAGIISGQRSRQQRLAERETLAPTPTPVGEADTLTTTYEQQSDSDELSQIEADLRATSFEGIDAELADIDKELNAE